jgi:hypothetical protein
VRRTPEERAREAEAAASQRLRRDFSNEDGGPLPRRNPKRVTAPTSASSDTEDVRYDKCERRSMVISAVDAQSSSGANIRKR